MKYYLGRAIEDLNNDYEHMKDMIYGNKPPFDDIIESLMELENEINALV